MDRTLDRPRPVYFDPAPPRVLAHRGLALRAPENTLAAFRAALEAGATHLETDAHASADGHAVLWHDPDLGRFDGSSARIAELSLEQLRRRRVDGHAIPTLAEALEAFPGARFNIDLKSAGAVPAVAAALEDAAAGDRVLVASFSERNLAAFRRRLPRVAVSASRWRVLRALLAVELGCEAMLARALRGVAALQIPERAAGITLVAPGRLAAFKRHVREVHVWTVNEPERMRRLLAAGVDGLVTDRADLAAPIARSGAEGHRQVTLR